jgi:MinD superfamily P-loop ATPase
MEVIKNSVYNNIAQCYGCSMCTYLCPKDAINMKKDEKGFFIPKLIQSIVLIVECVYLYVLLEEKNSS